MQFAPFTRLPKSTIFILNSKNATVQVFSDHSIEPKDILDILSNKQYKPLIQYIMTAGIIIVAVILAFALYDYFSTKSWQLVTSDTRNDTVFEKRNKKYGAYKIRRDYNRQMILILLGLSVGVGGIYAATAGGEIHKKKENKVVVVAGPIDPIDEKPEIEEKPEQVEKPTQESTALAISFVQFKITDNKQDTASLNVPTGDVDIADKDTKGTDPFGGDIIVPDEPKGPTLIVDGNGIVMNVDEAAYFIGGEEAQTKFFIKNAKAPEEGSGTTRVKFVVSKDGSISRVTVKKKAVDCPECDDEAVRLVKAMPRWEPGKVNGIPVDSYFTIPITFR